MGALHPAQCAPFLQKDYEVSIRFG